MTNVFTSQAAASRRLQPELFRPPLQYPAYAYAEMLTKTAARYSEHTAIVFNDVNLTYRELESLVNACARGLLALGISRGQTVCLLMTNRAEYVISWFAIARIGAVASPMNPSYKEREIAYQLDNSDAVAIIVQQELLPLVEAARAQAPALRHIIPVTPAASAQSVFPAHLAPFSYLLRSQPTTPLEDIEPDGEDLLALPYSSGTTGPAQRRYAQP